MAKRGQTKRVKRRRIDDIDTVANDIGVPLATMARAGLELVTVQNRTEDDQRHMVRSGQAKTVKRVHMLDRWRRANAIDDRQLQAGNAWAELRHAGRYDTVKVANYDPPSSGSADPLSKVIPFAHKAQVARFRMRDIIEQMQREDISRLDAVSGPSPIRLAGRGGQAEFIAIKLALSRLASVLKIGA